LIRYVASAGGLGLGWYLVLQVPSTTRGFLAGIGQVTSALLLCLVSILVATVLRRFIANADNDLWLTVVGPYSGAVLFGLATAVTLWVRTASAHSTTSTSLCCSRTGRCSLPCGALSSCCRWAT
jgi:hypothetical protein